MRERLVFVRRWFAGFLQFTATISDAVHSSASSATTKTHSGTDAVKDGPKSGDWTPLNCPRLLLNKTDDARVTRAETKALRIPAADQEIKRDTTLDGLSLGHNTSSVIAEMEEALVDDHSEVPMSDVVSENATPMVQVDIAQRQLSVDGISDLSVVLSDAPNAESSAKGSSDRSESTDVIAQEQGNVSPRTPLAEDAKNDEDCSGSRRQMHVPEGNVSVLPVVDTTMLGNYSTESVLFDAVAYITQEEERREQGENGTGTDARESAIAGEMVPPTTPVLDIEKANSVGGTLDEMMASVTELIALPPEGKPSTERQEVEVSKESRSLSCHPKKHSLLSKDVASSILPSITKHDPRSNENKLPLATDLRGKSVDNAITVETAAAMYQSSSGTRLSETTAQTVASSTLPHHLSVRPPPEHRKEGITPLKTSLVLLLSQKTVDHDDLAEIVYALARSHSSKHDTDAQVLNCHIKDSTD